MPTIAVPVIRQEHYQAFRDLPTANIPKTFDEWRNDRASEERDHILHKFVINPIEIYPEEFARFCRERGIPMNFHAIKALVDEKFGRQNHAKSAPTSTGLSERKVKIVESPDC